MPHGSTSTAGRAGTRPVPIRWTSGPATVPPGRSSWYYYFTDVAEADILENVAAIDKLDLPIDVIQIDDGWQSELGDWLTLSGRFASLSDVTGRVRDTGRRTGIWVAPFMVGRRSQVFQEHPDWLIDGVSAGHNWDQDLFGLDLTHPGVQDYLRRTFTMLREVGIDYFKID